MKIPVVHECADCGARLATAAGLSVHQSIAHSPAAARYASPGPDVNKLSTSPVRPRRVRPHRSTPAPVRLVATLIAMVLMAGVAAAVHVQGARPSHPAHVASALGAP